MGDPSVIVMSFLSLSSSYCSSLLSSTFLISFNHFPSGISHDLPFDR